MVLIFFNDVREIMILLDHKDPLLGEYKTNDIARVLTSRFFLKIYFDN